MTIRDDQAALAALMGADAARYATANLARFTRYSDEQLTELDRLAKVALFAAGTPAVELQKARALTAAVAAERQRRRVPSAFVPDRAQPILGDDAQGNPMDQVSDLDNDDEDDGWQTLLFPDDGGEPVTSQEALRDQFAKLKRKVRLPAPVTAAAGHGRGVAPPGNTVTTPVLAEDGVPGWASFVPPLSRDDRGREVQRSEAEAERLIETAQAAYARWRAAGDAARLAAGHVPVDDIRWEPLRHLIDAARANPGAPAWCVSVWISALAGPNRSVAPLEWEHPAVRHLPLGDFAFVHSLVGQLCTGRPNPMPNPQVAGPPTWRHGEAAWEPTTGTTADPLDGALIQALRMLTPDGGDPTCCVRDNELHGDSPAAKLGGLITGPRAAERYIPSAPCDTRLAAYGHGSPMHRVAEMLRGDHPEPVDDDVLRSLTDQQRAALARLVQDT